MKENNINFLNNLLDSKKKILELIVISILLGVGVSLISSSIFDFLKVENRNVIYLIVGLSLIILSLIYFIFSLFGKRKFHKEIEGFFIVDRKHKNIINIDNYDYSNKIYSYLNSARAEDLVIETKLQNVKFGDLVNERKSLLPLIQDVSEYYFLENLSTHLSAFFNSIHFDENKLRRYKRSDIPDILLSNQFLELFSKPMNQRMAFVNNNLRNAVTTFRRGEAEGEITSSFENGAMYQKFDLILPNESKISRENQSVIKIKNGRFEITVETIVSGVSTYIPFEFMELYLSLKDYTKHPVFLTTYRINIEFSKLALFKSSSWKYYKWIDSFLNRLETMVSQSYYFGDKIEWNKIYPIIKAYQKGVLEKNPK